MCSTSLCLVYRTVRFFCFDNTVALFILDCISFASCLQVSAVQWQTPASVGHACMHATQHVILCSASTSVSDLFQVLVPCAPTGRWVYPFTLLYPSNISRWTTHLGYSDWEVRMSAATSTYLACNATSSEILQWVISGNLNFFYSSSSVLWITTARTVTGCPC